MITNSDLSVVPQGAARTLLDDARADTCERVAHRLSTGSLDRIRRVVLRLLARASVSDPATRTALQAEADELDAAVQAAARAQPAWAAVNPQRRARVMFEFKRLVEARMDELATLLSSEHGKTFPDAKGDIQRGVEVIEGVAARGSR